MGLYADIYMFGLSSRARLLKKNAWFFHQIGDEVPLKVRNDSEAAPTFNLRY